MSTNQTELRPLRKGRFQEAWAPTPQPSGGVFHNFKSGAAGAEDHTRYITREDATEGRREALVLHNYPRWIEPAGAGYKGIRERVCEYNRQREEDERRLNRNQGEKIAPTHYKVKLSFEGKVETERAAALAREYLREQFPHTQAVAAVHQNTAHTHVHVHIQARGLDGRKLHWTPGEYRRLDEAWARIYGREFGGEKTVEHLRKKDEMRDAKRRYREGLVEVERDGGDKGRFKREFVWPERAPKLKRDRIREQERRAYGDVPRAGETPGREPRVRTEMHYVRVNRERPCPVCHKADGCSVASDGARANCVRVVSERAAGIGYWHDLKERPVWLTQEVVETSKITSVDIAPIEHRDGVYRAVIEMLKLHPQDIDELQSRGLSERAIEANQYRTAPSAQRAQEIAQELSKHYDLRGVPGFYRTPVEQPAKDGEEGPQLEWRMNVSRWHKGFVVPIVDADGRVEGFQIRRIEPRTFVNQETGEIEKEPKYVWLSSVSTPDKPRLEGSSSGSPVHFHNTPAMRVSGRAIITEGSLKAGVIGDYLGQGVIAVAGVGTFSDEFGKQLRERVPELKSVSIAFDADYSHNAKVQHQMERLERVLREAGYEVGHTRWPEDIGKGLDDYCRARLGVNFAEVCGETRLRVQGLILHDIHSPNTPTVAHDRKLVEEECSGDKAGDGRHQRGFSRSTSGSGTGDRGLRTGAGEMESEERFSGTDDPPGPGAGEALRRSANAADRATRTIDRTAQAARRLGADGTRKVDRSRVAERSPFDVDF